MRLRLAALATILVLGMVALAPPARAFPDGKPVTLIVPFAAGGGTDAVARELSSALGEKLGVPVIVENKGGGGGMIGAQTVQRARKDGHTLLLATSTLLTGAAGQRKLPYDVLKDFTPITLFAQAPLLVVVNKDAGLGSIADLVARARAKPGSIDFASSGIGSILHLAGEQFAQAAGVKMVHVPYQGSGPALVDLLAGHVQVFVMTPPLAVGHIKGGSVKLLASTGAKRSPTFPDVPTVRETGIDFEAGTWWGVIGPADLPADVVALLDKAVKAAAATDRVRQRLEGEGATLVDSTPASFAEFLSAELTIWRKVVADGDLKFE